MNRILHNLIILKSTVKRLVRKILPPTVTRDFAVENRARRFCWSATYSARWQLLASIRPRSTVSGIDRGDMHACPPCPVHVPRHRWNFVYFDLFWVLFSSIIFGFWWLRPQTEAVPLVPRKDWLPSPDPIFCPSHSRIHAYAIANVQELHWSRPALYQLICHKAKPVTS